MVGLDTRAGVKTPVEVSAEILATLRQRAEDSFDDELFGAVITVPAYFDDAQRQATKDAAAAGRPERAAPDQRAHRRRRGLRAGQRQRRHLYVVYDLGGGTFDISLLRLRAACSRWWPPAATRRWAATTSTTAWPPGRWPQAGGGWERAQDKRAAAWWRARGQGSAEQRRQRHHGCGARSAARAAVPVTARSSTHLTRDLLIERTLGRVRRVLRDAKLQAATRCTAW
jgi:molecular chaperone HscA